MAARIARLTRAQVAKIARLAGDISGRSFDEGVADAGEGDERVIARKRAAVTAAQRRLAEYLSALRAPEPAFSLNERDARIVATALRRMAILSDESAEVRDQADYLADIVERKGPHK